MATMCEACGIELDSTGKCPACLLQLGISHHQPSPEPAGTPLQSIGELNQQFPQLEITRLIGQGGMGAIYHARQTNLDRDVALKVIAREVAGDAAFLERFEREAKTLAKLAHPNIVTIYDYGQTDDGQAYLVMEYVDGINLREAMAVGSAAPEDALEIVRTICKALEFAHSKGVVHRDIKPENILLGEDGNIKVADFGIAKIIDDSVRTPTLTATRQVLGSLHYLAPEHLESPDEVDHRVDLYALGVVFYELLTGQLPLGRYEPPSVLREQQGYTPQPSDARLDATVMKTLNRKPAGRFQQAAELSSELQQLQGNLDHSTVEAELVTTPSERAISVPFTCEAMGGFAEAVGMVHVKDSVLSIEYRVRDAFWGTVKSQTHVVDIPAAKLSRIDLISGLFSSKIVILADKISTLDTLPNAETGRAELVIKRNDYELAVDVVNAMGYGPQHQSSSKASRTASSPWNEQQRSAWMTFGILMPFCGILNAGLLAVGEYIIAEELNDVEFVMAAVLTAVMFGPVALLQVITGLCSVVARPTSLARTATVVSMLPIAPAFPLSLPLGIWGSLWLYNGPGTSRSSARQLASAEPGRPGWGATTIQFIRESRWSKSVAALNIGALLLCIIGLVLYQRGVYPSSMRFRVVNTDVDANHLTNILLRRLGKDFSGDIDFERGNEFFHVHTMAMHRTQIEQALKYTEELQLAWIAATTEDLADENGDVLSAASEAPPSADSRQFDVSPDLKLPPAVVTRGPLGQVVTVSHPEFALESSYVAKVRTERGALSFDLSSKGREVLAAAKTAPDEAAGVVLIVNGLVEGFADAQQVSGKSLKFTMSSSANFNQSAIMAAVRGPALPTQLELIAD